MREVKTAIDQIISAMQSDYPDWDIDKFTPDLEDEPQSNFYVIVSPGEMTHGGPDSQRLIPNLIMNLEIRAILNWVVRSADDVETEDLFDIGASLLSWGYFRYVNQLNEPLIPISASPVLRRDIVNQEEVFVDRTRFYQLLTWRTTVLMVPSFANQDVDEYGYIDEQYVALPLTEFNVNGEDVL